MASPGGRRSHRRKDGGKAAKLTARVDREWRRPRPVRHDQGQQRPHVFDHNAFASAAAGRLELPRGAEELNPDANVYIANLPNDYSSDELWALFSKFGAIVRHKFVPSQGDQPGYGFVQYKEVKHAKQALKEMMNHKLPNGDALYLSVALRRRSSLSEEPTNLYIKNLPEHFTNSQLQQVYSKYGRIRQSRAVGDGIAFVRFESHDEALTALDATNGMVLCEGADPLEVKFANRKPAVNAYRSTVPNQKDNQNNLYIRNLPSHYGQKDLEELFVRFGRVSSSRISENGVAFVRYAAAESAAEAVKELNGKIVGGSDHPLVVKLAYFDIGDSRNRTWKASQHHHGHHPHQRRPVGHVSGPPPQGGMPLPGGGGPGAVAFEQQYNKHMKSAIAHFGGAPTQFPFPPPLLTGAPGAPSAMLPGSVPVVGSVPNSVSSIPGVVPSPASADLVQQFANWHMPATVSPAPVAVYKPPSGPPAPGTVGHLGGPGVSFVSSPGGGAVPAPLPALVGQNTAQPSSQHAPGGRHTPSPPRVTSTTPVLPQPTVSPVRVLSSTPVGDGGARTGQLDRTDGGQLPADPLAHTGGVGQHPFSADQQKLGNIIWRRIASKCPEYAGKITGMLLNLGAEEAQRLIDNPHELDQRVNDAIQILSTARLQQLHMQRMTLLRQQHQVLGYPLVTGVPVRPLSAGVPAPVSNPNPLMFSPPALGQSPGASGATAAAVGSWAPGIAPLGAGSGTPGVVEATGPIVS